VVRVLAEREPCIKILLKRFLPFHPFDDYDERPIRKHFAKAKGEERLGGSRNAPK
jgi:hypothetical protein